MNMFQNLNQPQLEAVQTINGPLLVLAGAGTGKTKVLTSRIINILNLQLANPLQILAVTFTNKAAAEMRHRIGLVIGEQVNNLWIGTFHSIASKILRRHSETVGLKSDFTIIDSDDQTRLIKQILADLNIDGKQFPAKNYLNKISRAKDVKLIDELRRSDVFSSQEHELPKISEVFRIYQNRLKSMNCADFGDLLSYNLEVFEKAPEILSYYQDKFHYVLVDEYQDTNNIQYQWLLKLANKNQNICAVGDDDQSIYSWRGANIANILSFEKDFKNAKIIRLEQNYRSTSEILKAADSIISNNSNRHGKTLWTEKKGGEKVRLFSLIDDRSEARFITSTIEKYLRDKKYQAQEMAILVRAGYQTRAFEDSLIKLSIPYKIIGGMKFYERLEVKDSICYLRISSNFNDDLALLRIINTPKRGVGQTSIQNLHEKAKNNNYSLFCAIKDSLESGELKGKTKESLKILISQIERWNLELQNQNLSEITHRILEESGYIKMWQADNSLEAQGRIENIDEFTSSLADFENITEFLEYVSLIEAKEEKHGQEAVSLMTVHGAKGLEFDLVFIPGLEDGIFPSSRSVEERNGEEEERRLLYVAITRAKKELIMSNAQTRFIFGDYTQSIPSRFLKELPNSIEPEQFGYEDNFSQNRNFNANSSNFSQNSYKNNNFSWQKANSSKNPNNDSVEQDSDKTSYNQSSSLFGKRVFHQKFGYGKVIGIDGAKVEVDFEKTSKKTLMQDFVKLA